MIHFGVQVIGALLLCRKLFEGRDCALEQFEGVLDGIFHFTETRYQPHLDFPPLRAGTSGKLLSERLLVPIIVRQQTSA
jgi:hypothetical protein